MGIDIFDFREIKPPLNWKFFLSYYVFEPWRKDNDALVRLFEFPSGTLAVVRLESSGSTNDPHATLTITGRKNLSQKDKRWIKETISRCFDFEGDVSEFYDHICQKDPVLKAACSTGLYGARLRTDPDIFESVLGVVVAQNVQFSRVYTMRELLCRNFGRHMVFDGETYYTFPSPHTLADAPLSEIRACKVGYRDKYIKGIAEYVTENNIDLNDLRSEKDTNRIRQELMKLPGVGPYTADLTLAIGFRRPTFHLDVFSREAIYTFYFGGKKVSDEEIREFVDAKWGNWKHYAMLLLTTNTDQWAEKLDKSFRLKSAARNR